jgi:peptidoglycan/LPS O-acetylase OafA/YrhL
MISKKNNFDLIRLFAAMQVVILHGASHLGVDIDLFKAPLKYFPGVPIFFVISGFLITASFARNPDILRYAYNRILRIFPALWVCFLITVVLLVYFGVISSKNILSFPVIAWVLTQVSFLQFYTPDSFRSWGVGAPNGSLWTIPVEIQFYVLLPLIVLLLTQIPFKIKLLLLSVCSVAFNFWLAGREDTTIHKLMGVSIFPFLYNFLIGSFLYFEWEKVRQFFEGKALWWLLAFAAYCGLFSVRPDYYPTATQFVANLLLACLTISCAFTANALSERLLRGYDISYGVYIYHMVIINSLIALGFFGQIQYFLLMLLLTTVMALLSWIFVERKALRLKLKR